MNDQRGPDLESVRSLYALVCEDVELASRDLAGADNDYHRRVYVRSVFAAIEATTYLLKQEVLHRTDSAHFATAEVALLKEETYSLGRRGEAVVQQRFLPLDQNFLFALRMLVRDWLPSHNIELGDGGWESFRRATLIRHRITHPKAKELMSISDEELETVRAAYAWFNITLESTVSAAFERLKPILALIAPILALFGIDPGGANQAMQQPRDEVVENG